MIKLAIFEFISLLIYICIFYLILIYLNIEIKNRFSIFKRFLTVLFVVLIGYTCILRFECTSTIKIHNGLHEVAYTPTFPYKSNNPSFFNIMYIQYITDSNGYLAASPHILFYGLPIFTSLYQGYNSPIEIDRVNGTSKITFTLNASTIFFNSFSVYDIVVSKDGKILINNHY